MDETCCVALSGPLQLWPLSLLLYSRPELHWNTVDSNETNEIVSFGDGDKFQTRLRDCLVWGWGGGEEYCQATRQASSSHLEVGWGKLSNEKSRYFSRASFG